MFRVQNGDLCHHVASEKLNLGFREITGGALDRLALSEVGRWPVCKKVFGKIVNTNPGKGDDHGYRTLSVF
jgi:hypothetical protein